MKLAYPVLNECIEFTENSVNVLVLENPVELRRLLSNLKNQIDGQKGELVLSENAEILDFSKAAILVTDPLSLDFSSRKLLAKINQEACGEANAHSEELYNIMAQINELALSLGNSLGFEASFEFLENWDEIIKLMGFHVDTEALSFPEQILEYISVYQSLFKKSLFVFYNLKASLSQEELSLFYKSVFYRKFNLLLIEDHQRHTMHQYEKTIIVDKDLCVI